MRQLVLILLVGTSIGALAHPMDKALKQLSKARVEISKIAEQNANDPWLTAKTAQLSNELATVWADAMLVPVQKNDLMMSSLGYSFTTNSDPMQSLTLQKNDNAGQLAKDTDGFISDRWKQLAQLTDVQINNLDEVRALMLNPEYTAGFSYQERDLINRRIFGQRADNLTSLKNMATNTANCIDYFNEASKRYGLKLVVNGEQVSWSPEEFYRLHGSLSTQGLSAQQKPIVKSEVEDMLSSANSFGFACTSPQVRHFLLNERRQLEGASK